MEENKKIDPELEIPGAPEPHEPPEPHGPEGPGPRGPHGPHDPHGPHGPRPPHPPIGDRSVTEAGFYGRLDTDGKIMALLRELGRLCHVGPEGRAGQDRVLHVLRRHGVMSQRDLTERLGIRPGSASEILSKLEAAGLIARVPSEADRRGVDISLTAAGEERAAKLDPHAQSERLLAPLSESERETLLGLLEKLSASFPRRQPSGEDR